MIELKFFKNSQINVENLERNHILTSNRKAWDRFWEENLGNETEFFVNELLAQRLQAT